MKRLLPVLACLAALPLHAQQPSLLLVNGKIWTVDTAQPEAEAVAIRGNRIIAVGSSNDILKLRQPNSEVINLQGRRVLPGFNDAHVHFYSGGASLAGPQLRYCQSAEELRKILADFAQRTPSGTWITGGNWDEENWTPPALPTRQLIDGVTRNSPVFVNRLDGHESLANSLALKLAGITHDTKDVPGGVIVRDEKGNPTGVLKDAAQELVRKVIPPPTPDQIRTAIRAAQAYANAQGVTSVQDMYESPAVFRVYQSMLRNHDLSVRVAVYEPLTSWQRLADVGLQAGFGSDYLRIGGVKGFADGSLGSHTALFFQPYRDAPETSGIASAELSDPSEMLSNIEHADASGLQVAVHAIGDKANDTILNFYDRVNKDHGERDRRFRIEHAQHLIRKDIPRFAKLHIIASMQPYQCIDDGRWAEKRIGPERAKTTYAFRSLLDSGAVLAFGSDWDVAPMSPILGIYAAATRRTLDGKHPGGWIPEQKIGVKEAIRAYTMGSAFASFDEQDKGSIEPGKLADMVVLTEDILAIDPTKIPEVKVLAIVFDGQIIKVPLNDQYQRDPSGLILRRGVAEYAAR